MRGVVHSVLMQVLRVYYPDAEERSDPELYAVNLRRYMKYEYDKLKLRHVARQKRETAWPSGNPSNPDVVDKFWNEIVPPEQLMADEHWERGLRRNRRGLTEDLREELRRKVGRRD